MAAILNSVILDSDILHKITFTCSFWLNLMMAAILNSAMLYSAMLVFPVKLTHTCLDWSHHWHKKKLHSHFPPQHLHKNFTHSFWLNLMMAAILNSFILDSSILVFPNKLNPHLNKLVSPLAQKTLHSQFPPHHLHKKLHLFILTQLDDGSHLEFCHVVFSHCHLGFRQLVIFSQIYS